MRAVINVLTMYIYIYNNIIITTEKKEGKKKKKNMFSTCVLTHGVVKIL